MMDSEIEQVAKIAYLGDEDRAAIVDCLRRRSGLLDHPDCELAMASLGKRRAEVELALCYPPVYLADAHRRREFDNAHRLLADTIEQISMRGSSCCGQ